jgi:putative membrane protein
MGGGWVLMTLFWVLLIVAVVGLVVWIFPRGTRPSGASQQPVSPREVLDLRLARGEIDVATYRALRQELHGPEFTPR